MTQKPDTSYMPPHGGKVYQGTRYKHENGAPAGTAVIVGQLDRAVWEPLEKHDPTNHSPAGYEWGYGGSGPAALGSTLVHHATGCTCGYREFTHLVVASWDADEWAISALEVQATVAGIRQRREKTAAWTVNGGHEPHCPVRGASYSAEDQQAPEPA